MTIMMMWSLVLLEQLLPFRPLDKSQTENFKTENFKTENFKTYNLTTLYVDILLKCIYIFLYFFRIAEYGYDIESF